MVPPVKTLLQVILKYMHVCLQLLKRHYYKCLTCITADRVTLTFTHMDLEVDNGCNNDFVQVLDGIDENAPLVGKFCGSTSPSPITSQGMSLYVQFVSDAVRQESGFRATYTKATSGNFENHNVICIKFSEKIKKKKKKLLERKYLKQEKIVHEGEMFE